MTVQKKQRKNMTEFDLWIAGIPGLGKETLFMLWAAEGKTIDFAEQIYRMEKPVLCKFAEKAIRLENEERYRDGREQCSAVLARRAAELLSNAKESHNSVSYLRRTAQEYEKKGIRYIWAGEPDYPERLRCIDDPPFGLFVKGRLPNQERPAVGIVGARMASTYGKTQARRYASSLAAAGVQVISGMARGIDGIAGRGALDAGDDSFAVLGGGVDICYPKENRDLYEALADRGGLISEYRPGVQPQNRFFPSRNRIISGLSDLILVIESRERSGTLITVDRALEQGKDVWALPGRVDDAGSSGCNRLIRQGAGIALSPEIVLEALGLQEDMEGKKIQKVQEDADHGTGSIEVTEESLLQKDVRTDKCSADAALLRCLDRSTPHSLDDIYEEAKALMGREISFAQLQRELVKLMIKGRVYELRVGQYVKG